MQWQWEDKSLWHIIKAYDTFSCLI
jgi:hypothetical protein